MSEAYTRLIIPRPVGVSKDSMDDYREEYADGKLRAPVDYLPGTGPEPTNRMMKKKEASRLSGNLPKKRPVSLGRICTKTFKSVFNNQSNTNQTMKRTYQTGEGRYPRSSVGILQQLSFPEPCQ